MTTREQWLEAAIDRMRPWFASIGHALPTKVRASIGFPSRMAFSLKTRRVGECWAASAAADGSSQIFITPLEGNSVKALDTLVHELVHAAVGTEHGHKGAFKRAALAIGLTGKMRSSEAGPELIERLNALTMELGAYPHSALNPAARTTKKQSTRMIKARCGDCPYIIRTTAKWVAVGLPTCHCGGEFEVQS